jgi:hypothetical protein
LGKTFTGSVGFLTDVFDVQHGADYRPGFRESKAARPRLVHFHRASADAAAVKIELHVGMIAQ